MLDNVANSTTGSFRSSCGILQNVSCHRNRKLIPPQLPYSFSAYASTCIMEDSEINTDITFLLSIKILGISYPIQNCQRKMTHPVIVGRISLRMKS